MKSTSIDNPFAVRARKPAVFRSLKTLFVIVLCLAAVLTVQFGSKHWLLRQLTTDWNNQSAAVREERLKALSELGDLGRPMLVGALTDPHRRVARSAFDLLLDQQSEWLTLDDDRADEKHREFVEQLAEIAGDLPQERRGWLATLLNTAIAETVEHSSDDAALAYSRATALLASSQLKPAAAEIVESSSVRVALRTEPLPLDLEQAVGVQAGEREKNEQRPASTPVESPSAPGGAADGSGANALQTVQMPNNGELQSLAEASEAVQPSSGRSTAGDVERVVVPVQHLTAAPFETYSTRSVIAWLRSVQPKLRDIARNELIRRGFDEAELALAARMADPDIRVRLGLLNDLSHRGDIDPRPWLLWMAEDAERDVRLRALTSLATMQDPNIRAKLRERLPHESDPAVVSLLRRVLSQ